MQEFPAAPLDMTAKVLSGLLVALLGGQAAWLAIAFEEEMSRPVRTLLGVGLLAIPALTWALAPKGYAIQAGELVVRRHLWQEFRSPLRGIAELDRPENLGLRMGGSGGGFGYYGRFRRRDIGGFRAYLTTRSRDHVVAVRTEAGIVVVSPQDPTAFHQAVTGGSR